MAVKTQPDGYHTLTPYLIAKDAGGAIEFYEKVFGARAISLVRPGRKGWARRAQNR